MKPDPIYDESESNMMLELDRRLRQKIELTPNNLLQKELAKLPYNI